MKPCMAGWHLAAAIGYGGVASATIVMDAIMAGSRYTDARRVSAITLCVILLAALIRFRPRRVPRGAQDVANCVDREHVGPLGPSPQPHGGVPFEARRYRVYGAFAVRGAALACCCLLAASIFVGVESATQTLIVRANTSRFAVHRAVFSGCVALILVQAFRIHEFEVSPGRLLIRRHWPCGLRRRVVAHLNLRPGVIRVDLRNRALIANDGMRRLNASLLLMSGFDEMLFYLALGSSAPPDR